MSVYYRSLSYWESDVYWRHNNKQFAKLAPTKWRKTADMKKLRHCHRCITTPQPFYGPFFGTIRVSRCQKTSELLDFIAQGKINRGRHADNPAGRHSIRTNQCPPPPSRHLSVYNNKIIITDIVLTSPSECMRSTAIRVSVCPSVLRYVSFWFCPFTYLKTHMFKIHDIFCTRYPWWPWLGPPLTTMQ